MKLLKLQRGGLLTSKYKQFKDTLPENLRNTKEREYAMKYLWKKSGKPVDFEDAINRENPLFQKENDGLYHGFSIEPTTMRFLKPKNHPSLNLELEWYNSPEGESFRQENKLVDKGRFYKYKPRKK